MDMVRVGLFLASAVALAVNLEAGAFGLRFAAAWALMLAVYAQAKLEVRDDS